MVEENFTANEQKAAYNQSGSITEFLRNLMGSYILSIANGDFKECIASIETILDIISAKVKNEDIKKADEMIVEIIEIIPEAIATYVHNGHRYLKNVKLNNDLKIKIRLLFRYINKLQDKYGYGMASLDDPRFAVLQH